MKILVEKIYEKPIEWMGCPKCKKKVCEHGLPKTKQTAIARTAFCDGVYYKLKGWGADLVEAGQEISGTESEEEYTTKDGEKRTAKVLTLEKPLSVTIEKVYDMTKNLSFSEFNQMVDELAPRFEEEVNKEEINIDDIPF